MVEPGEGISLTEQEIGKQPISVKTKLPQEPLEAPKVKSVEDSLVKPSLKIEAEVGIKTQELLNWLEESLSPFYNHLARLSLDKLNGKGWEEITYDNQRGWMKFPYDDGYPLNETEFKKRSAHLQFTGKFLCGHFAYIIGKAIKHKFPDVDLNLIKLGVQMSEQKGSENHPALDHRLLEVSFENEPTVLADFSYGQVEHSTPAIIVPVDKVSQYFPNPYRKSDDKIERIDFIEAEEKMKKEFQEGASRLSREDLNDLIQIFNNTGISQKNHLL